MMPPYVEVEAGSDDLELPVLLRDARVMRQRQGEVGVRLTRVTAIEVDVPPDGVATATVTIAGADGDERRVRCTVYDLSITAVPHATNGARGEDAISLAVAALEGRAITAVA